MPAITNLPKTTPRYQIRDSENTVLLSFDSKYRAATIAKTMIDKAEIDDEIHIYDTVEKRKIEIMFDNAGNAYLF